MTGDTREDEAVGDTADESASPGRLHKISDGVDENGLRSLLAREAIQLGKVPDHSPDLLCQVQGESHQCAVCGLTLGKGEVGYRLDYAQAGHESVNYYLHSRCFTFWLTETRFVVFGSSTYHEPRAAACEQTSSHGEDSTRENGAT